MSTRSRSHQLEDISINEFNRLLPAQWVSRRKTPDYGIDLEVEIFDDDGESTGIAFNVQLKATDSISKSQKVRIDTDRLKYAFSLDLPTLYVRYCDADKSMYGRWIFDIDVNHISLDRDTLTLTFGGEHALTQEIIREFSSSLAVLRALRVTDHNTIFRIILDVPESTIAHANIQHRLVDLFRSFRFLEVGAVPCADRIPINVRMTSEVITIGILALASTKTEFETIRFEEAIEHVYYSIISLMFRFNYVAHAQNLAKSAIPLGLSTASRELAAAGCATLSATPRDAVTLAIANKLHHQQDINYNRFLTSILYADPAGVEFHEVMRFYKAAEEYHRANDLNLGAIFYSIANLCNHAGEFSDAVVYFNKARRQRGYYLYSDYFLAELGSSLYRKRKYRCAEEAYRRAYALNNSLHILICLADANLFSGHPERALGMYLQCNACHDEVMRQVADHRIFVCESILAKRECDRVYDPNRLAEDYADALERMDLVLATELSITLCAVEESSSQMWAEAMRFTFLSHDESRFMTLFNCSHYYCGAEPYNLFRIELEQLRRSLGRQLRDFTQMDALSVALGQDWIKHWPEVQSRRLRSPGFDFDLQTEVTSG